MDEVIGAQTIAVQNERNDVDILRHRMDASVLLTKTLGEVETSHSFRPQVNCASNFNLKPEILL
jgi:hypothetical protein